MNNDFSICLGDQSKIQYHGRIRRIRKYVDGDTFLLTYGDGVSDVDIRSLLEYHKSHGKIATVTTVRPISRFGMIEMGGHGSVSCFNEKPKTDGWMSAGFFVLNSGVFDYLGGDDCIFERDPMERLVAAGELMAYRHEGFFYAMDTYREYQHLNELWSRGKAPWRVWK